MATDDDKVISVVSYEDSTISEGIIPILNVLYICNWVMFLATYVRILIKEKYGSLIVSFCAIAFLQYYHYFMVYRHRKVKKYVLGEAVGRYR